MNKFDVMFTREEVDDLLTRLEDALEEKVSCEFDAAACQTRMDFGRMGEAQDRYADIRDEVLDALVTEILQAKGAKA